MQQAIPLQTKILRLGVSTFLDLLKMCWFFFVITGLRKILKNYSRDKVCYNYNTHCCHLGSILASY